VNITLKFGGDHPLDIAADALSGYHRPLSGEVANLTATCVPTEFFPDWLSSPPLGVDCAVVVDGEDIMAGVLYGCRVTAETVELKVEG
jgi:hypothetical protein